MAERERLFLSGDEAVALAAHHSGVSLGTGYPGTPSTEILEALAALGGRAQWAPNEKVALEVGLGVAFAAARTLVTMKHVGLNVAADPLFTAAYTGVSGGMVVAVADDPGMASSQNEQDSRRYAVAAGVPMLEPTDAQEAYDYTRLAFRLSERWRIPLLLRLTTRVCHCKSVVRPQAPESAPAPAGFARDIPGRVMIPAYARPAHRRLRQKLAEILAWNEAEGPNRRIPGAARLGVVTSGISAMHVREADPEASLLVLGMTFPVPVETIRAFAASVERCLVVEEGDPHLQEAARAAGIPVADRPEAARFGELNVARVRELLTGTAAAERAVPPGKPPQLCNGCPHRNVFTALKELDCIVAGDIGCYTLGALPPFDAMDTCVCMGASLGVGLGLRHALPAAEARRVVSVIGDSTFMHTGIPGLVEMVYNPPATGHLLIVLDNGTTAMTGMQEHPGTGRTLDHRGTSQVSIEALARAMGVADVHVVDPILDFEGFRGAVAGCLGRGGLALVVARRTCLLATGKIREYERAIREAGAQERCDASA